MARETSLVFLVGFDRSGTSAVSKTLAMHPKIELLWRLFNSGPIRAKMNTILNEESITFEDTAFLKGLENGRINLEYVKTPFHLKTSTVGENFAEGHLHVLISNINHFASPWIAANHPLIEHWLLWRNPYHILQSCVENDFISTWYGGALNEVLDAVRGNELLMKEFGWCIEGLSNDWRITAFLIAVKNSIMLSVTGEKRVLDYDVFKENPNLALSPLLSRFNLSIDFDFSSALEIDLNTIPSKEPYVKGKKVKLTIPSEQHEFLYKIFSPLFKMAHKSHTRT